MKRRGKLTRVIQSIMVLALVGVSVMVGTNTPEQIVQIDVEGTPLVALGGSQITYTENDKVVIPDKYNTGAKGELYTARVGDTIQGITFKVGNNGTANRIDFRYCKITDKDIVFDSVDFSGYELYIANEGYAQDGTKISFHNCIFSKIRTSYGSKNIAIHFSDCTITSFGGSNATFSNCMFGGTYTDALVPYCNVTVKDSYFCNMASTDPKGKGVHTDATQIYGTENVDVTNVHYDNCRFEVPAMPTNSASAIVNACIMLQLEYSDGDNISINNCILNGGGYSLYASSKNGRTFSNTIIQNLRIGCSRVYGLVYPTVKDGITTRNIINTDSLYVGTVWKENGKTFFSVTNDTNVEREFKVFADGREYSFQIPACPVGQSLYENFEDYPFDIPICIEKDVTYAVCYDVTFGQMKQIRFANWSNGDVIINEKEIEAISVPSDTESNTIIFEGTCGPKASFELTKAGVLTISGTGATDSYHSQKTAPWFKNHRLLIREVVVEDGITQLGNQLFDSCSYLEKVSLPNSLTIIGSRAFAKCSGLLNINIPASVKNIYDSAFVNVLLQSANYDGNEEEWEQVSVNSTNNSGLTKYINFAPEIQKNIVKEPDYLEKGDCGKRGSYVQYTIDKNGVLTITGKGEMDDYHSKKDAPWKKYKSMITSVVVENGVSKIGNQSFIDMVCLNKVDLPNSLTIIGSNAFQRCKGLKGITIPMGVKSIWAYAFHNSSLEKATLAGVTSDWSKVRIAANNSPLLRCIN